MPTPALLMEVGTRILYKIGRTGFDSGSADEGGSYTIDLNTGDQAPLGYMGLCHFRRVGIRVLYTAGFTITMKVYVDDLQTQIYDAGSNLVNQSVTFTRGVPAIVPYQEVLEMDISKVGSFVGAELTGVSNAINGVFLLDEMQIHYRSIRQSRETTAAKSQ